MLPEKGSRPDLTVLCSAISQQPSLSLTEAIDAVIADAVGRFSAELRADRYGMIAGVIGGDGRWLIERYGKRTAPELALAMTAAQWPSRAPRPFTLTASEAETVLRTLRACLRPVTARGIGSRLDHLWTLLWLPRAAVTMPEVAELLREGRTPNSRQRKAAKDPKYLWRLRTKAIEALAATLEPLVPAAHAA